MIKKSFSFVTNNQHLINIDKKNLKKSCKKVCIIKNYPYLCIA